MNAKEIDILSKKSKAEIEANWQLNEKIAAEIRWAAEKGLDYASFLGIDLSEKDMEYLKNQGFYIKHNCDLDRPRYRVYWNKPAWYDRFKEFGYMDWILTGLYILGFIMFIYIVYLLATS